MPITRKIVQVGNSRAVIIPPTYIRNVEKETGQKLKTVGLEITDIIRIFPIFEHAKDKSEK